MADTRVVLVIGARQCGKSTLVRVQARDRSAEWRNLDSMVTRQAAASDPTGFVDFDEWVPRRCRSAHAYGRPSECAVGDHWAITP